jgi:hypothetical protein
MDKYPQMPPFASSDNGAEASEVVPLSQTAKIKKFLRSNRDQGIIV